MSLFEDAKKHREQELQLKIDFVKLQLAKEEPTISEGIKSLLAVNGGGIVAMLGFMQALITKTGELTLFKYYGANSMLLFCAGLLCATLVPAARLIFIKMVISHQSSDSQYPAFWESAAFALWGCSACLFLGGVVCAILGIRHTFSL